MNKRKTRSGVAETAQIQPACGGRLVCRAPDMRRWDLDQWFTAVIPADVDAQVSKLGTAGRARQEHRQSEGGLGLGRPRFTSLALFLDQVHGGKDRSGGESH